jgi:hypothetical protein
MYEYEECMIRGETEYAAKFKMRIEDFVRDHMPQNVKIWRPYQLCFERSESNRLVFKVDILNKTHLLAVESSLRHSFTITFGVGGSLDGGQHHWLMQALLTRHEADLNIFCNGKFIDVWPEGEIDTWPGGFSMTRGHLLFDD